jgi:uncharacterized membrane protein
MNIHPLFVHFPIALLVVYSLLEIVPGIRSRAWAQSAKVACLYIGVLGAIAALITGGMAEELVEGSHPRAYILEVHAPLAGLTSLIYLILAAAYLVRTFDTLGWGERIAGDSRILRALWEFKKRFWRPIRESWVTPVLALAGLVGMVMTGALGAAIVYGPSVDPVASFVYHLFFAS